MALCELLQRRSSLFIPRNAFQRPLRCFSSKSLDTEDEKSSKLKKTDMAKQQRAEVVESFVKKYMDKHPGTFPKATQIQNEVGGSLYTVKETLQLIKEKMLGAPQPDNNCGLIDSVLALAPKASNSNLSDQTDSAAHTDHAVMSQNIDEIIIHTPINAPAESSADLAVDARASDVTNVHDSSGTSELHATFLSEKSEGKACGIEKNPSANIPLVNSSQTEGTMELSAVSDSPPLELENGDMLHNEVHSNMCKSSGRNPVLNSANFFDSEHSKVNYTGNRDQKENKELISSLFLLCSEMTDESALHRSSEKVHGLADLFTNYTDDGVAESKKRHPQDRLHLGTFSSEREGNSPVNSSDDPFSSSESASELQLAGHKKSDAEYENHPTEEEMVISSEMQSLVSKGMKPFATAMKTESFTINDQASKVKNIESDMFMERYMGRLEDHEKKDAAKTSEIKLLIDCIKKLPLTSTAKPHEDTSTCENGGISNSNRSLHEEAESLAVFQGFGKKGRSVSEGTAVCGKLEDDRPLNILPADLNVDNDTAKHPEFSFPYSVKSTLINKKDPKEIKDKPLLSKASDENKVVVKFLRFVTKKDLYEAFWDCGDISKVEMSIVEGAFYQVAFVYFRTREGLRKAVGKTNLYIRGAHTTVEAVDSVEDISDKIPIPSLIDHPGIPVALIRNPTRTLMIRKLTKDISLHHIEAALAFCSSSLTGFFFGSSKSDAYVEFETEEGKETALAKRYIDVLGKRLSIARIDVPRTTVVRIFRDASIEVNDILKVCQSAGKVTSRKYRCGGLVDVHYCVTEWPNMVNILNRLNATEIDGWPLLAQPATVIPPQILRALWYHPEERKYVKAMVQKLLHKVGENVPIRADFLETMGNFYRDKL